MRFDLMTGTTGGSGVTRDEQVDDLLWRLRFAEDHGFDTVWIVEHHFTEYAMNGAPSAILAFCAANTQRVHLGYAVAVLPLHHPLRLAEEICWVDAFSRGRLRVGIGPGWSPLEYEVFRQPIERKQEIFREHYEILRRALGGQPFRWEGEFWQFPELQIFPGPYRPQGPPFYRATSGDEAVAEAGRMGLPCILGIRPPEVIAEQRARYCAALDASDHDSATRDWCRAQMGVLRPVTLAATRAEGLHLLAAARQEQVRSLQRLKASSDDAVPDTIPVWGPDGRRAERAIEDAHALDGYVPGRLIGSAEDIVHHLRVLQALGIGRVLLGFGGRGIPYADTRRWMERFAAEVMPAFEESPA